MSAPITKVKREGKLKEIPSSEVVPGDIVILETGNFVPADCRIINSVGLKIEESALTGETIPVTKNGDAKLREDVAYDCLTNEEVLANADETKANQVKVPKVVG